MERSITGLRGFSKVVLYSFLIGALAFSAASAASAATNATRATATAVLLHPGNHVYMGTVIEDCSKSPATLTVYLEPSRSVEGTEILALEPPNTPTLSVSVSGQGASLDVHSFGGASATGCYPAGSTVMLVSSPGGMLQTLWLLLGEGVITPVH